MMTKQEIRIPTQNRAIAKKQAIAQASFKLFSEKGYYKTNTVEIAKEAGVSTGIVYSYFQNKKDILFEVVQFYIASLSEQFQPLLSTSIDKDDLPAMIERLIAVFIASHQMNMEAHNEFLALSLLENDIHVFFNDFENDVLQRLYKVMLDAGFSKEHLLEKLRISYAIIEHVCHDYIQRPQAETEWKTTKTLTVDMIVGLFHNVAQ